MSLNMKIVEIDPLDKFPNLIIPSTFKKAFSTKGTKIYNCASFLEWNWNL